MKLKWIFNELKLPQCFNVFQPKIILGCYHYLVLPYEDRQYERLDYSSADQRLETVREKYDLLSVHNLYNLYANCLYSREFETFGVE